MKTKLNSRSSNPTNRNKKIFSPIHRFTKTMKMKIAYKMRRRPKIYFKINISTLASLKGTASKNKYFLLN
jgi:hypothetical protein